MPCRRAHWFKSQRRIQAKRKSHENLAASCSSADGDSWLGEAQTGFVRNSFIRPYEAKPVQPVNFQNSQRIFDLMRAGQLYLSLADAIALALENNLDIEVERYLPRIAQTDIQRAKGGGLLRGLSLLVNEPPPGIGGPNGPAADHSHRQSDTGAGGEFEFFRRRADHPTTERSIGDRRDSAVDRPGDSSI